MVSKKLLISGPSQGRMVRVESVAINSIRKLIFNLCQFNIHLNVFFDLINSFTQISF